MTTTAGAAPDPFENIRRIGERISAQFAAQHKAQMDAVSQSIVKSFTDTNRIQMERFQELAKLSFAASMPKFDTPPAIKQLAAMQTQLVAPKYDAQMLRVGRSLQAALEQQTASIQAWRSANAQNIQALARQLAEMPQLAELLADDLDRDLAPDALPSGALEIAPAEQWQNWYARGAAWTTVFGMLKLAFAGVAGVTNPVLALWALAIVLALEAHTGGPPRPPALPESDKS